MGSAGMGVSVGGGVVGRIVGVIVGCEVEVLAGDGIAVIVGVAENEQAFRESIIVMIRVAKGIFLLMRRLIQEITLNIELLTPH